MTDTKTYVGLQCRDMGFDAHMTLHYFGKGRSEYNINLMTEAINPYMYDIFFVKRKGIELFGPNKDIPVVTVEVPGELKALNAILNQLVPSPSEYPWNPHITLKLLPNCTVYIPDTISLTHIGLYS